MKIVVCVKQVAMLGDEVEFTSDERGVDPDYFEFALNEWDSYATEEAVSIKEAAGDGEVVVVCVGDEEAEDAMRRCIAMGADRGIRIDGEGIEVGDPITTARALATVVQRESADLVLCGVQSSDAVRGRRGRHSPRSWDSPGSPSSRSSSGMRARSERSSSASSRVAWSTSTRSRHRPC